MGFKELIDKVLLGATGVGLIALAIDHYRPKPEKMYEQYCPYCRQFIYASEFAFATHVAHDRRYGIR